MRVRWEQLRKVKWVLKFSEPELLHVCNHAYPKNQITEKRWLRKIYMSRPSFSSCHQAIMSSNILYIIYIHTWVCGVSINIYKITYLKSWNPATNKMSDSFWWGIWWKMSMQSVIMCFCVVGSFLNLLDALLRDIKRGVFDNFVVSLGITIIIYNCYWLGEEEQWRWWVVHCKLPSAFVYI